MPCFSKNRYAPGNYLHPLENVSEVTLKQAQQDYEAEIDKRATGEGVRHDTTQYNVYEQKV